MGELMTSLWEERFAPQPARIVPVTGKDNPEVWDWIFEKDSAGEFVRAGLVLLLVRNKAKELRQRGIPLSQVAEMATLGVWEAHGGGKVAKTPKRGVPIRKGVPVRF